MPDLSIVSAHGHLTLPRSYLGVDIGSAARKVCNFCLIEDAPHQPPAVTFERGCKPRAWPENRPGHFENLTRPGWLAEAAEAGVNYVLTNSRLVTRWLAQATDGAAVVDAPCGFAIPGETCRDTEIAAHVAIYRTPTSLAFHQGLQRFGGSNNAAPLRQRYYWKLVGFAVYRWLAERALGHVVIPPCEGLASLCLQQTSPRLREGFPSLTYVRAQWGCLPPAALCVLDDLVQAEWMGVPPAPGGHPLNPPLATLRRLITLRRAPLINELAHPGDLSSMCKAEDDPIWGDLWDAFTLAFVGRCEDYGAARFFRGGRGRETQEGAILSA